MKVSVFSVCMLMLFINSCNDLTSKKELKYIESKQISIPCDSLTIDINKIFSKFYFLSEPVGVRESILEDTISKQLIIRYRECNLLGRFQKNKDSLKSEELIWYFIIFSEVKDKKVQPDIIKYLLLNKNLSRSEIANKRCPYYYAKKAYFEINGVNNYQEIDCFNNSVWHGLPIPE